jgi:DNA invertase Pin-like site-specific DNA recombinase
MASPSPQAPLVAGYIRVSSARQRDASESPANQRLRLQQAGATLIFEDLAISGYRKASRKNAEGWKRLWTAIEQGQVNRLLAVRLDRYGRRDSLVMELAEHCERHGVSFETLGGGAIDLTSPSSWIAVKVELMMAEFYSRQLSANIRAAQAAAIDRKVVAFTSKHLGWQLRRIEGTRHGVEPHPDRWDDARTAVLQYIAGDWSMDAMSAWIYERHGVMKTTGALLKWLHSHNIRGHYGRRDGPVLIANCFPALISEDEADQLELRLKANSRKRGSHRAAHYTYPLSGVTRCQHCGSTLNYSCVRKSDGGWYRYLRCPSRQGHCQAAGRRRPEWQIEEALQRRLERVDIDAVQVLDSRPADAPPSRELVEAKRRLRKLEGLLEEGEDVDLRAAYAKQVDRVAELSGTRHMAQASGLRALIRRMNVGSSGWYERQSDGERNNVWLQALAGSAAVDLLCTGEGWQERIAQAEFKL